MQTRITTVHEQLLERQDIGVHSVSNYGVRLLSGTFLFGPVALFPNVALSWHVLSPDDITEDSLHLFALLEPRLDLVIVGAGVRSDIDNVRRRVMPFFRKHRIGCEVMLT
jgi:NADH dehydrogenase [ubiquinone] 1 alpha subcomplex assembly factor 3